MRRTERECLDRKFLEEMLCKTDVMTVTFQTGDFPYVLPFHFVLHNDVLYFHCALEGRKLECLKRDSRVGFSLHELLDIDREKATTHYTCLCGAGQAEVVEDKEEKRKALAALAEKYRSRCMVPVPDRVLDETAVVRISINSLCGKINLP